MKKYIIKKITDFCWRFIIKHDKPAAIVCEITPNNKDQIIKILQRKQFVDIGDSYVKGFCKVSLKGGFAEISHLNYPGNKLFCPYVEQLFLDYISYAEKKQS